MICPECKKDLDMSGGGAYCYNDACDKRYITRHELTEEIKRLEEEVESLGEQLHWEQS